MSDNSGLGGWKEVSRKRVFDKYRKVDRLVMEMPDGLQDEFFINVGDPAAAVLSLTSDNKVVLAQQYRVGSAKVLWEMPGGAVDEGESVFDAAKRELLEETGYEGELEFVGQMWVDAWTSIERHYFVARNCQKVTEPNLDQGEFAQALEVSIDQFRSILRKGQMTDVGGGYLCLDYLNLL